MKILEYQLNSDNYKELNSYMAVHDRSVQKKMLSLMVSLSVAIVIITLLITKINLTGIICSLILIILLVVMFPKVFWNIVFKRIDKIVDSNKLNYPNIRLSIDKNITINDGSNIININFKEVEKLDFTKSNCMIFYYDKNKLNALVIPNNIFTESELKDFCIEIEGKISDAKK